MRRRSVPFASATRYHSCVMPGSPENWMARIAPGLFVVLWSSGFIGAKFGLPYAEPFTFLSIRMAVAIGVFAGVVLLTRAPRPPAREIGHNVVTGLLVHGAYLGGVFVAIGHNLPAGLAALVPGLQPVLTATLANLWIGERVVARQWLGLGLGVLGVYLVVHGRAVIGGTPELAWAAIVVALAGITLGTLYQKRFGGTSDLRTGMLVQYGAAGALFTLCAFAAETRHVVWTADFLFAVAWLVLVLSVGAVWLLFWLIRRSAATRVVSLFYLTPAVTAAMAWLLFDERLDALSLVGMAVCAAAVLLVNVRAGR